MRSLSPVRRHAHAFNRAERSKALFFLGLIIFCHVATVLLLGWRASRFAQAACTLRPLPNEAGYCALFHSAGGSHRGGAHPCTKATGWSTPEGTAVPLQGSVACYYYLNDAERITTAPPNDRWLTPIPSIVAVLSLALMIVGAFGWQSAHRALSGLDEPLPTDGAPYRQIRERLPSGPFPARRELPRTTGNTASFVVGALLALLGISGLGLVLQLAWTSGGSLDFALIAAIVMYVPLVPGTLLMLYRSGIVIDSNQGVLLKRWGLLRPWCSKVFVLGDYRDARISETKTSKGARHHSVELAAKTPPQGDVSLACSGHEDAVSLANAIDDAIRPWLD